MATESELTIITLQKMNRIVRNMEQTFAPINVINKIIDTSISKEQPTDQNVGDLWFIESERI